MPLPVLVCAADALMMPAHPSTAHGIEDGQGFALFKPFDEKKNLLQAFTNLADLMAFIEAHRHPLVIPFSMDVVPLIFQVWSRCLSYRLPLIPLISSSLHCSPLLTLSQAKSGASALIFTLDEIQGLQQVAEEFRGKITVATADASEKRLLDHMGVKASDFPVAFILVCFKGCFELCSFA
jgi:hypothetical protein